MRDGNCGWFLSFSRFVSNCLCSIECAHACAYPFYIFSISCIKHVLIAFGSSEFSFFLLYFFLFRIAVAVFRALIKHWITVGAWACARARALHRAHTHTRRVAERQTMHSERNECIFLLHWNGTEVVSMCATVTLGFMYMEYARTKEKHLICMPHSAYILGGDITRQAVAEKLKYITSYSV